MSIVKNRAPLVDMALLNKILATRMSTVCAGTSPGNLILSPPMVNQDWLGGSLSFHALHAMLQYVTTLPLFLRSLHLGVDCMLLVP